MRIRRARSLSVEQLEDRSVPATYYVATTGSDSAAGDSGHPWRTIQHAADRAEAGDTINVRAGSYAGFILGWDFVTAGTAANPITFQSDPGAAPGSVIINARNNKTNVGIDVEPGCRYITIQGFTVDGAGFSSGKYGIKVTGDYDRVIGNTVKNFTVATAGIHSNAADGVVIQGNTVFGIGAGGNANNGHGIYIANGDGLVVRGNTLYSNEIIGLHVNGDPNLVSNALIENNIIYNNGKAGINADGLTSSTVRNNLIYGYTSYGISLYQIDSSGPSTNNTIVNNTIVSTVSGADGAVRIKNGATGNILRNNVLLGGGGISIAISTDSIPGLVSNYNVVGTLIKNDDNGSTQSIASWRTSRGQDVDSITATAVQLFVDPANANYHLKTGSPAINVGTSTSAPPSDFEGDSRPAGGIDIGFDEVASTTSTTRFQVAAPATSTAGSSFTITVSALTSADAVDASYRGTVHFTSTDGLAGLPANYAFVAADNGVHSFTVTLKTAGSQSVTATDTATSSITGNASSTVGAAAASVLQVSAPSTATAGASFTSTVTVKDAFGNTATGYRGTVRFTSTDGQATLPSNYAFVAADNGVHSFTVTLKTAGSQSITATDTVTSSITGSASTTVGASAASVLQVSAPSTSTAGASFTSTVTVKDAYGNTATGYRGTVRFTSTDGQATLPSNYAFVAADNGVHSFTVTLKTAGSQTITATDTATSSIAGSASVSVTAAAGSIQITSPSTVTAGLPFAVTATVKDEFGNTATGYRGTVRFTSTDGRALLPPNYTFDAADGGRHTFFVIMKTAGMRTVTATDTVAGALTGDTRVRVKATKLLGSSNYATGPDAGAAPIAVMYNPDGSAKSNQTVFAPTFTGGVRTSVADFNGDGVSDMAVGTGPGTRAQVKVFDGATGETLLDLHPFDDFTGGVFVAAGFVTDDGLADLVVTPDVNGGPRVSVYEGGSFSQIASFFGIDDANFRGGARAAVGDVTGDGLAELVVSAGFGGGPRISVYDGAALLQSRIVHPIPDFFAFESTLRNGAFLAVGDVNGDGENDVIFGAGPGGGPRVLVTSGPVLLTQGAGAAINAPIANFFGGDPSNRGGIRVAVKDINDDEYADVLTGSGENGGSGVTAYSGMTLANGAAVEEYGFDAIPGFAGGVFVG